MVSLAGYEDLIPIHESANSQVYRAHRVIDTGKRQPIILKFLNQDYPTSEQIAAINKNITSRAS